jgi:hypothetical protein
VKKGILSGNLDKMGSVRERHEGIRRYVGGFSEGLIDLPRFALSVGRCPRDSAAGGAGVGSLTRLLGVLTGTIKGSRLPLRGAGGQWTRGRLGSGPAGCRGAGAGVRGGRAPDRHGCRAARPPGQTNQPAVSAVRFLDAFE